MMQREEEERLIRRVVAGDAEAFAPLVERYGRPIFSLVLGIVRRCEVAEEVTQDVFLKAYTHLASYGGRSSFSTWLYRIAYNTALTAARPRRTLFSLFDQGRSERMVDTTEEDREAARCIESREAKLLRAIDRLTPEDRALVQLHYYESKSLAECGEIFGQTETNCKVRLHRIRKKLELWINEMS